MTWESERETETASLSLPLYPSSSSTSSSSISSTSSSGSEGARSPAHNLTRTLLHRHTLSPVSISLPRAPAALSCSVSLRLYCCYRCCYYYCCTSFAPPSAPPRGRRRRRCCYCCRRRDGPRAQPPLSSDLLPRGIIAHRGDGDGTAAARGFCSTLLTQRAHPCVCLLGSRSRASCGRSSTTPPPFPHTLYLSRACVCGCCSVH